MQRVLTLLILIISSSLVFCTAASAQVQSTVDVTVLDQEGVPVDVTHPDSEVEIQVNANSHLTSIQQPFIKLTVNPEDGLILEPENAIMYFYHDNQEYGPYTNNPNDPFLFWSDEYQCWIWYIGWYGGAMYMNNYAKLITPAKVTELGIITVATDFYGWPWEGYLEDPPILQATNRYTFPSVLSNPDKPEHPTNHHQPSITPGTYTPAGTVPMQNTGTPLTIAILGLISISSAIIFSKT